ncbi:unnamed protein product [Microthlaspi erraticum]|uniref:Uncharacterized protein n=1 Tax=Microthlaspi erraticum TaxID=1685480 RepID=A0A6D2L6W0_9BRAS|nr:unnamed protein product [Microthlaspi erraticum]
MGYTKLSATIVHEYPSLLRTWWSNKNLQYDVVMSPIIIIINFAAIVHMRTHKIPFNNEDLVTLMIVFLILYIATCFVSFLLWFAAIEDVKESEAALYVGRIAHTLGFGLFLELLYCISPHLALRYGVPGLIWFVATMVAPCCPSIIGSIWRGLCQAVQDIREWWKHVNQPRSVVVYV